MTRALSAVLSDGLSIRRAAEEYHVPRTTLGDRVSGRIIPGAMSGKPRYLSDKEEEKLVTFLLRCASVGYPRSRKDVIAIVQRACFARGLNVNVTHGWWEAFCRRHPVISLRTTSGLSVARAKASNPEVISSYFDMLEDVLLENELVDKPTQIFNMDETGMPLNPVPPKGVCKRGTKVTVSVCSGDKSQITVVGCVSAAGYCIPPMVIWDRKTLHPDMAIGEVPGTLYGLSSNGWMDMELFHTWFTSHFLKYAPSARPLLLLMDGHSTHYSPDTIEIAAKQRVLIFILPPNTTHLSQPLDKGCFGPLKKEWQRVCHEFMTLNPGKVVTRHSFSKLFGEAWMSSMSVKNIMSGFSVTGIYPLDRKKLSPLGKPDFSPVKESGLAYIPMLSPAPCRSRVSRDIQQFSEKEVKEYIAGDGTEENEQYRKLKEMYRPYPGVSFRVAGTPSHESPLFHSPLRSSAHDDDDVVIIEQHGRSLSDLLKPPSPLSRLPPLAPQKPTSRVLTSSENLKALKEKVMKKEEAAKLKEQRRRVREEKKRAKLLGNESE